MYREEQQKVIMKSEKNLKKVVFVDFLELFFVLNIWLSVVKDLGEFFWFKIDVDGKVKFEEWDILFIVWRSC